jgi:hypothetical protein
MHIVSIDVGIKNLAICVFDLPNHPDASITDTASSVILSPENTNKVVVWDVINLAQKEVSVCSGREKGGGNCLREARFTKHGVCYCMTHSKNIGYHRPSRDLEASFLKKQKVPRLREIAEKHCILYDMAVKKADLINIIAKHGEDTCFEVVDKVDANKLDIVTIGRNIQYKLDILFNNSFDDIGLVLIENQISPIANRMKTIQGMLSQYFLMKNNTLQIEFVSSMNKLKEDGLINTTYSERKNAGISKCLGIISSDFMTWVDFFNRHKKKDDLADCFLQGMWYIRARIYKTL